MNHIHAPLRPEQRDACDAIAALLLRDGIGVVSYDSVVTEKVDGRETVRGVHLHVVAERDIPDQTPNAKYPIEYAAGDCWQEVWYAWNDPGAPQPGLQAMRIV